MNINQLLASEQIAIMRSDAASEPRLRDTHEEVAGHYGGLLSKSAYPHRPYRTRRSG